MAKNVFAQSKEPVRQPKRNTFDLSFQNNLTMRFGCLYPVFCKDVMPGDSFRIKPTFGLRFMPMTFPVQTRMQANLHFFYVRTRNLWKDFPDFIGRTKQNLVTPYLSKASLKKVATTGALGDYMGLPTTLVGDYGTTLSLDSEHIMHDYTNTEVYYVVDQRLAKNGFLLDQGLINADLSSLVSSPGNADVPQTSYAGIYTEMVQEGAFGNIITVKANKWSTLTAEQRNALRIIIARYDMATQRNEVFAILSNVTVAASDMGEDYWDINLNNCYLQYVDANDQAHTFDTASGKNVEYINDALAKYGTNQWRMVITSTNIYESGVTPASALNMKGHITNPLTASQSLSSLTGIYWLRVQKRNNNYIDISKVTDQDNLYQGSNTRISALPFRAYESIYNAFYRNQQNDPFMIDAQVEYNKFIPSQEGGEDNNDYALRFRNWEQDYLTSCVPSPQQGIAPLVGVSASGEFTFENEDGSLTTVKPTISEDGDTLTGIDSYVTTNATNSKGQPVDTGALARMKDIILRGISISDFRNVNALQRWLEVNMRRGFRYKDQIMSHFGVDAKFEELDMPEFIGGMSEPVIINQVNQTVQGSGDAFEHQLGAFAGQASILAGSNHSITKYCDEHGYIIGVLSVSPVPNYTQLMPKMFLKHDTLDYFFPEFGHIGLQPVSYREVCPIQSFAQNRANDRLDDVFGYQRAWYDLLGSVDEVHGQMRTDLRKFLINRQFDERPVLGHDFIAIDPDQVNDVFTVTSDTDKIVGQVYFDVQAKRPIPRFGIPRLEA